MTGEIRDPQPDGNFGPAPTTGDSVDPLLRYFEFEHLRPGPLRETSMLFNQIANTVCASLPRTPERTVALRKLLESKDAAVRAALDL